MSIRNIDSYKVSDILRNVPEEVPGLFERIKAAIAKGNWIADGAMWWSQTQIWQEEKR